MENANFSLSYITQRPNFLRVHAIFLDLKQVIEYVADLERKIDIFLKE